MNKILIVGSNDIDTSNIFNKFGLSESVLVTAVDQEYEVGHTAPQEFTTIELFREAMSRANTIYWAHPPVTEFTSAHEYYNIIHLLHQQQIEHKNVFNYDTIIIDPYKWFHKLPTLTANDSVFIGCSYTAGHGLPDVRTRYSTLVAQEFGTNCVNLGMNGTSNSRSFDVFTQLNFVPGQIVVWQITFLERLQYCDSTGALKHLRLQDNNLKNSRELVEVYHRKFLLNELSIKLRAAVKIAREKKLRFVFWFVDDITIEEYMYFCGYPEMLYPAGMQQYVIDRGTDNAHPGPESNKLFADTIIKHINRVYK